MASIEHIGRVLVPVHDQDGDGTVPPLFFFRDLDRNVLLVARAE